jgi:hypothetical protein
VPKVQPQNYKNLVVRGATRATQYRESNFEPLEYAALQWQGASSESRCRVIHRNPWGDGDPDFASQTMRDYLGYSELAVAPHGETYINRVIPWEHPNFPNHLFAKQLPSMVGDVCQDTDGGGMGRFDEMVTTVQLGTFPFEVLTNDELTAVAAANGAPAPQYPDEATLRRYVSFRYSVAIRYEMVPSTSPLVWSVDGLPVSTRRAVLFVEGDLRIKWWMVPLEGVPKTAIAAALGKAGRFPAVLSAGSMLYQYCADRAVDHLVMETPTIGEAYRMTNGQLAVDVEYHFKQFPAGANAAYRWDVPPGGGVAPGFQLQALAGGGLVYPHGNFLDLFRPSTG